MYFSAYLRYYGKLSQLQNLQNLRTFWRTFFLHNGVYLWHLECLHSTLPHSKVLQLLHKATLQVIGSWLAAYITWINWYYHPPYVSGVNYHSICDPGIIQLIYLVVLKDNYFFRYFITLFYFISCLGLFLSCLATKCNTKY